MSGSDGAPPAAEPCEPRIVQLMSAGEGFMYGLDDTGRVWALMTTGPYTVEWHLLKAEFVRAEVKP